MIFIVLLELQTKIMMIGHTLNMTFIKIDLGIVHFQIKLTSTRLKQSLKSIQLLKKNRFESLHSMNYYENKVETKICSSNASQITGLKMT